MRSKNAILVGVLAGVMMATPVLAQNTACLQKNRIVSWRAFDNYTLVFKDRFMNEYTVQMRNACEFATRAGAILIYDTWQNLACLNPGQIIHVAAPGLARGTCSVGAVHAGGPGPAAR